MNSKEYQKEVLRTLNQELTPREQIINMALGLTGESGEVADLVKKAYFQGHSLDKEKLINELGDICWYLTNMCNCIGVELEDVFQLNIDKLNKRYKEGFSSTESIKRVDVE